MNQRNKKFQALTLGAMTTAAVLAFSTQTSHAALAVTNFDNTHDGSSFTYGGNESGSEYRAISFTTGNLDTQFESLSYWTQNTGSSQTTIAIYDANGSAPGNLYFNLSNVPDEPKETQITVTGSGILTASTTYFVVFTAIYGGDAEITVETAQSDGPDIGISGSGWAIGDKMFTANKVGIAGEIGTPDTWTHNSTTAAPRLEINVTTVPEPSSLALLGLAGISLTLRRKK